MPHAKVFFLNNKEFVVLPSVYEPREDSFLLAESLPTIKGKVLDVGTGTGIIALASLFRGAAHITAIDINPEAIKNVKLNFRRIAMENKLKAFRSNLFENVKGRFDVICFNPPYLPSEEIQEFAIDGGTEGREVLDSFLYNVKGYLKRNGRVYFLQSSLNGFAKTKEILQELNFGYRVIATSKLFFEKLVVFECLPM
ncbi:MAG: methyltransferase [Candidatus Diapherotrites archaeon]|nr:methyltransferase [Candidatus Diapherotrites archaeon]